MKRAQSATEFLMTYGWAIMAVMIVLGSLVYFGIIDVYRWVPETCFADQSFSCVGKPYRSGNTVMFSMVNNNAYPVSLDTTSIEKPVGCNEMYICSTANLGCTDIQKTVDSGEQFAFVMRYSSASITEGNKYSASLIVPYIDQETGEMTEFSLKVKARTPAADRNTNFTPSTGIILELSRIYYNDVEGFAIVMQNPGSSDLRAGAYIQYTNDFDMVVTVPVTPIENLMMPGENMINIPVLLSQSEMIKNPKVHLTVRYGNTSGILDHTIDANTAVDYGTIGPVVYDLKINGLVYDKASGLMNVNLQNDGTTALDLDVNIEMLNVAGTGIDKYPNPTIRDRLLRGQNKDITIIAGLDDYDFEYNEHNVVVNIIYGMPGSLDQEMNKPIYLDPGSYQRDWNIIDVYYDPKRSAFRLVIEDIGPYELMIRGFLTYVIEEGLTTKLEIKEQILPQGQSFIDLKDPQDPRKIIDYVDSVNVFLEYGRPGVGYASKYEQLKIKLQKS